MAFDDQPPWRDGNPEGYKLLIKINEEKAITAYRFRNNKEITITYWFREYIGGRDALDDDYIWRSSKSISILPEHLELLIKLSEKEKWINMESEK